MVTFIRQRALVAVMVTTLIGLIGCDGGGHTAGKPPTPTPSTAPRNPARSEPSPPSGGHDYTLSDAQPAVQARDYKVLGVVPGTITVPDEQRQALDNYMVSATGKLISALSPTPLKPEGAIHTAVAIIDPSSLRVTYLTHVGGRADTGGGVSGIAASKNWIAWTSSKSHSLETDPWVLLSYDRQDHRIHRLAAAPHTSSGVNPTAPGYTRPSLANNGRVYLDVVRQVGPNRYENDVDSVPADGSTGLRREVIGTGPVASGHNLVYDGDTQRLVIHERNLTTRHDTVLFDSLGTSCPKIFGLGLAGPIVAWGLRCGHEDIVQVLRNGRVLATIHGHRLGYFRATSGYVGFSTGSGPYRQYIYDIGADQLFTIGNKGWLDGDMPGNGRYLTWTRAQRGGFPGATYVVRLTR